MKRATQADLDALICVKIDVGENNPAVLAVVLQAEAVRKSVRVQPIRIHDHSFDVSSAISEKETLEFINSTFDAFAGLSIDDAKELTVAASLMSAALRCYESVWLPGVKLDDKYLVPDYEEYIRQSEAYEKRIVAKAVELFGPQPWLEVYAKVYEWGMELCEMASDDKVPGWVIASPEIN